MTVGDRIRQKREELGINQSDFARKIKSSKQTLYKYENNIITNIPYEKLISISDVLGVSPAFLMGWETPEAHNDDPELLADVAGDRKILDCLRKLQQLNEDDREKVYSYVDYIFSNKK